MNCFNSRNNEDTQPVLPTGFEYKKLFPKYKIIKPDNATRHQIKGTRIIISDRKLENEYYSYCRHYPWIKVKCFELTQPKEKYICIKITNKNAKNENKTIIFTNGETSNMCGILPILVDLSSYLRLNIITFEFPKTNPGQGIFKKEQDMLECVLTVISYVYASSEYKNFILMGYSTGVYLNYKVIELLINKSKKFVSKLKNIINISPMWCFDSTYAKKIFHNRKYSNFISNLIKHTNLKLKVSSFVSHGVKDNRIGYMISMNICSRLNFIYEWYPKEGDHFNILLKDNFKRKLFKRIQKFLSVEDISIGVDFDNSVISKLTNKGIKVCITKEYKDLKDLNASSGNFCFKDEKEKNISDSIMSSKGKYKIKGSKNKGRKESGFSFLDISIQKHINIGDDINEIKDEEDSYKDEYEEENRTNLNIINDEEEEDNNINKKNNINNINNNNNNKKSLSSFNKNRNKTNDNDNNNNNNNDNNNKDINNEINDDEHFIEIVSSIVTNNEENMKYSLENENDNKTEGKKGYLINDSFGCIPPGMKGYEVSFRKDDEDI